MKRKLSCILLIDDDSATNFYNEMIIKKAECTENIVAVQSGAQALEYLRSKPDGKHPQPELIFLDINMPAMNGWEFLEEYKNLDEEQKGKMVVVMLTTSLNPADKERAETIDEVTAFKNKPVSVEMLEEVISNYLTD